MSDPARLRTRAPGEHLLRTRPLVMLCGPPRVGKSTACRSLASSLLDWDDSEDRRVFLRGAAAVLEHLGRPRARDAIVGFDNLCRYRKWREFLRDFRARSGPQMRLIVTNDAAPEVERPGPAGPRIRCAYLRIHPWSVGECVREDWSATLIHPAAAVDEADWAALLDHGGFPEPFIRRDPAFTRQWHSVGVPRASGAAVQEAAPLHDPVGLQSLAGLLAAYSSCSLVYSDFSRELGVTVETVTRWVDLLSRLHYGFCVRPWFTRVVKALRREPKWFLRDWSGLTDPVARQKTFVACHLLKAVESWSDLGLGRFALRYVRDKLGREVDFLVTRNDRPWFLVTVGNARRQSECLARFQSAIRARHAFQLVFDAPFVSTDCFSLPGPTLVPARTLLSQLP